MLKVVRLAANFPRIVYLLAFDEERVGRVAGEAYGEASDGRQFLEKIIQYPFVLPAIGRDRLSDYVLRHAHTACHEAGIKLEEKAWADFRRICREALLVRLSTPRQAIRYANALRFALPLLKGEVDPFVQMLVEAARILFPELYVVLGRLDTYEEAAFSDNIAEAIKAEKPDATEPEQAACLNLVNALFRWENRSRQPISDRRYHERYFFLCGIID